ncbi:MAG: hypothetical protein JXA42_27120 [Anaerolineales bacterium]|nr:hypothetical protein [Anaerolineales bacterium]
MEIHKRVLRNLSGNSKRLDRSLYELDNGKQILFRTSKKHTYGKRSHYWFGFHEDRLLKVDASNLYVLFVCGTENQVVILPANYLLTLLEYVSTASDDNWKVKIYKAENRFNFSVAGKDDVGVTEYLNRYELLDIE